MESDFFTGLPSRRQNLTFAQLKSLYLAKGMSVNEPEFSNNLGLLTADGRYNQMAYVLADSNEVSIRVSVYSGTDDTILAASKEYGNRCLLIAMARAAEHAEALNDTYVDVSGRVRADILLYDADIFRAAWHNACLHSSWYKMVPPQINIYDDRMEIVSAGGLPQGMTEDEFFSGTSRAVNPELHDIMTQLGIIQPAEHGVQRILASCGRDAFRLTDNFITVTIPFRFRRSGNYTGGSVSNGQIRKVQLRRQILEQMKASPHITTAQLASSCGAGTATISNCLAQLTKDGHIAREGSRKTGTWKVL
ncbi:MAG: hypothetical protein LUD50_04415 [Clostridia bacterium]|nr:hypothetical protein [Clostridia bacterium]